MPVTYQIERARQFIHTRCSGAVVLEEIRQHFAVLSQDPECPERLDVARLRPRIQFGSCAIIAPREALFGMARMFEVFAEMDFAATNVFRTEAEGRS